MIIVWLGFIILYIYLIYCIIETRNVTLENNSLLNKLLEIEKKKQSDANVPQPPLPTNEADTASEQTKEISIFDDMNQDF